jgi:hypothetical protein
VHRLCTRPACWLLLEAAGQLASHSAGPCLQTACRLQGQTARRLNDKLIKETQLVWIKYTRSRAECYTHDT